MPSLHASNYGTFFLPQAKDAHLYLHESVDFAIFPLYDDNILYGELDHTLSWLIL